MQKSFLVGFFLLGNLFTSAQAPFVQGYFITNEGQKVDCLVKNIDWKNNPSRFSYKIDEDSSPETATLENTAEFGIGNTIRFIRHTVNIDRSGSSTNRLSNQKDPEFSREQVFLKVLVEGKGILFSYHEGTIVRYFYSKENANVEPLIYKEYYVSGEVVGKNNKYREQLQSFFNCQGASGLDFDDIEYKKESLVDFFIAYNECVNAPFHLYDDGKGRRLLNLHIRLGASFANLAIRNTTTTVGDVDFGNKWSFRFGAEAELMLPFGRDKWALFLEPAFQYYTSEGSARGVNVTVDYKSLEFPVGLRYYFIRNESSKIFINGCYNFEAGLAPKIQFYRSVTLDIRSKLSAAAGLGYRHKNRYGIEMRYNFNRDILADHITWESDFTRVSLIFSQNFRRPAARREPGF